MELEGKVSQAEDLNTSLQRELDKVRTEHDDMERDLRRQLDAAVQGGDTELEARFADLEVKHKDLQTELHEQQQVTEDVRREAARFLTEMKVLSEQSHTDWEREERLAKEVNRLEDEARQWKSRYTKAKTQLRHLRTSSIGISESRPDLSQGHELIDPDGLVKDVHVTKFQVSMDELLRVARTEEPHLVLQQMKTVIIAVRHVFQDLAAAEDSSGMLVKAKARVSGTANNLITASKNFASSSGLSPVSLLDAAASHLATAVIEVIRIVKIRSTPANELEEDDQEQISEMKSPYFSVTPSARRVSNTDSIYSAMSPPSNHSRKQTSSSEVNGVNKLGYMPEDHELQELKVGLFPRINTDTTNFSALCRRPNHDPRAIHPVPGSQHPRRRRPHRNRNTHLSHHIRGHQHHLVDRTLDPRPSSQRQRERAVQPDHPQTGFPAQLAIGDCGRGPAGGDCGRGQGGNGQVAACGV